MEPDVQPGRLVVAGLFPTAYFGNLHYYASLLKDTGHVLETHENWQKQTYRNRMVILGANGPLNLIVPIQHSKKARQLISAIRISNDEDWQTLHWRSLEAAYRSSPYFEYYEDQLEPMFKAEAAALLEFNLNCHRLVCELLKIDDPLAEHTSSYMADPEGLNDLRHAFSPKSKPTVDFPPYIQVFADRHPFTPNLSILDLLFNEGPNSAAYLRGLEF